MKAVGPHLITAFNTILLHFDARMQFTSSLRNDSLPAYLVRITHAWEEDAGNTDHGCPAMDELSLDKPAARNAEAHADSSIHISMSLP